ncbi:hypothetical protein KL925_003392 [Ogataea polymorpha]|uniref:Ribosome maturation protein SDO1 n=1 Tax=Ogataea polymorpha TaxID=460523 RepID=A0A9P8TGI9_9ASCO|nr:hypothetical protein KL937_003041 [Ogataea polymorpha]KAG7888480.1 hypothetical protein KL936_003692 [Ogataea polymorpha]KAG7892344.1 hypothetical protein KL908_003296 [Ogataea polymorpha]KAG7900190.1 hypothetical protein KL935_002933 [Ogataea polymorpha]KAG7903007.1 hypothetical protein KL907_004140 [Ogataea polymorpha]
MAVINQPSSQIRLTNVSLVRMKKGKKRFEIACYQNKVQDYRAGVEKDLDEVLQIPQVFINVSKGQVASNDDLKKAFGSTNTDEIILEILKKGEIQLSEKERSAQNEKLHNEILTIISTKCINPKTKKRYPPTMIDKALKELKFNSVNAKNAKAKALEAIKLLVEKQIIPISRAHMKLRISLNTKEYTKIETELKKIIATVQDEEKVDSETEIMCLIEPEYYKELTELVKSKKGSVEVLDMAVIAEGESNL